MKTKAALAGHPIHPALIAFPVAFYTATFLALIVFEASKDLFWLRVGLVANVAGIVAALVAAVPGAVDLFVAIPERSAARATGLRHAGLNVTALGLFAVSALLLWSRWREAVEGVRVPSVVAPLLLSVLGLGATAIAGGLGWKLVQTHHVGVIEEPGLELPPAWNRIR